ncbi:MAG: hypothetical protein BWY28_00272 [bacterium ADurb.Bin236]|nr:MAG: hypothetical protein BWY28_00272 [bacterium ADurb.Bin236]
MQTNFSDTPHTCNKSNNYCPLRTPAGECSSPRLCEILDGDTLSVYGVPQPAQSVEVANRMEPMRETIAEGVLIRQSNN